VEDSAIQVWEIVVALKLDYKKVEGRKEAYSLVKKNLKPTDWEEFGIKAQVDCQDRRREITAKGTGFTLFIHFADEMAELDLDLSLLLRPFKKRILAVIEKRLRELL